MNKLLQITFAALLAVASTDLNACSDLRSPAVITGPVTMGYGTIVNFSRNRVFSGEHGPFILESGSLGRLGFDGTKTDATNDAFGQPVAGQVILKNKGKIIIHPYINGPKIFKHNNEKWFEYKAGDGPTIYSTTNEASTSAEFKYITATKTTPPQCIRNLKTTSQFITTQDGTTLYEYRCPDRSTVYSTSTCINKCRCSGSCKCKQADFYTIEFAEASLAGGELKQTTIAGRTERQFIKEGELGGVFKDANNEGSRIIQSPCRKIIAQDSFGMPNGTRIYWHKARAQRQDCENPFWIFSAFKELPSSGNIMPRMALFYNQLGSICDLTCFARQWSDITSCRESKVSGKIIIDAPLAYEYSPAGYHLEGTIDDLADADENLPDVLEDLEQKIVGYDGIANGGFTPDILAGMAPIYVKNRHAPTDELHKFGDHVQPSGYAEALSVKKLSSENDLKAYINYFGISCKDSNLTYNARPRYDDLLSALASASGDDAIAFPQVLNGAAEKILSVGDEAEITASMYGALVDGTNSSIKIGQKDQNKESILTLSGNNSMLKLPVTAENVTIQFSNEYSIPGGKTTLDSAVLEEDARLVRGAELTIKSSLTGENKLIVESGSTINFD